MDPLEEHMRNYKSFVDIFGTFSNKSDLKVGLETKIRTWLTGEEDLPFKMGKAKKMLVKKVMKSMKSNMQTIEGYVSSGLEIVVDRVGEGLCYDLTSYDNIQSVPDDKWGESLPSIVGNLFGGRANYEAFGRDCFQAAEDLKNYADGMKLKGLEKKGVQQALGYFTSFFKEKGEEILKAAQSVPK